MYKYLFFVLVIIAAGCKQEVGVDYFSPEMAKEFFAKVEATTTADNGKLWGSNLNGPIMYVDQTSRSIYANMPDKQGLLKEKDGLYVGVYPREKVINNIAVEYGGTLFSMAPLPMQHDDYRIYARALHGLFHVYQANKNLDPGGYNTRHLNDPSARLWLKLEWKALEAAILSDNESRTFAIRDALIFRGARHEAYPNMKKEEVKFENYEGLATFTYTYLCSSSPEEFRTRLLEYLGRIYNNQSYIYSYGFIHGALYAYLLNESGYDFQYFNDPEIDLAALTALNYDIKLPGICRDVAGSIALNYNIEKIRVEEEERAVKIKESILSEIGVFTEKSVVYVELISPSFSFEPEDIKSLDTLGTLYSSLRVSDDWGKLTAANPGCLVSNNLKYLRITAKNFKEDKNHCWGEGWHLMLNDNWQVVRIDQNIFIRRLMP